MTRYQIQIEIESSTLPNINAAVDALKKEGAVIVSTVKEKPQKLFGFLEKC